jgi:transposase-like protein
MARRWPAKPITAMADREGTFDPKLIQRYQRRFPGFDEKTVLMYARGMTVGEIQGHLLDLYGLEVSPDLISTITDAVLEPVAEWQNRPLEPMYPLIFFDALRVKIRDEGLVRNKAVYVALGVTADGTRDIVFPDTTVQTCIVHLLLRQRASESVLSNVSGTHGLQPHRVRQFKLSNDPRFVDKLRDVVRSKTIHSMTRFAT